MGAPDSVFVCPCPGHSSGQPVLSIQLPPTPGHSLGCCIWEHRRWGTRDVTRRSQGKPPAGPEPEVHGCGDTEPSACLGDGSGGSLALDLTSHPDRECTEAGGLTYPRTMPGQPDARCGLGSARGGQAQPGPHGPHLL